MSDSPELLKPGTEVIDSELQIKLGNLKVENETLKGNYAALLESSTRITNKLREEVREVRLQLERERADREKVEEELSGLKQKSATARELPDADYFLNKLRARLKLKLTRSDAGKILEILKES